MSPFGSKPDIDKLIVRADIKGLIKALQYASDPLVRTLSAMALGDLGVPSAVEPLLRRLKDKDEVVRGKAAEALGNIGDPRARAGLVSLLSDESTDVRVKAQLALNRIDARSGGRVL